jgi:hypothetical protein
MIEPELSNNDHQQLAELRRRKIASLMVHQGEISEDRKSDLWQLS